MGEERGVWGIGEVTNGRFSEYRVVKALMVVAKASALNGSDSQENPRQPPPFLIHAPLPASLGAK